MRELAPIEIKLPIEGLTDEDESFPGDSIVGWIKEERRIRLFCGTATLVPPYKILLLI